MLLLILACWRKADILTITSNMLSRVLLPVFTFLCTLFANGQSSYVTFIKERPDKKRFNTSDSTLVYPVFKFKNPVLSNRINSTLKADFSNFYDLKSTSSIRTLLKGAAENGLVELQYNEVRNDDKVLSFYMSSEAMAAYPTYWETPYAFNKKAGQLLTLDSLIIEGKRSQFLELLQQMQKDSIEKYKEVMLSELDKGDLEKEDYEYILEQTKDNCWEYFSPRSFKLYKEYIEVIIDCEFPHVIMALSPPSVLTIRGKQLKEYLKPEFLH